MKLKTITQIDVNTFIVGHPSFLDRIDIPDEHWKDYLKPTPYQETSVKAKFYTYLRMSLDQLIDEMEKGFEYRQALKIIKAHGFGLPIRVQNWGYKEPLTVDNLLEKLEKNTKHWELVYDNAKERQETIEQKKILTQTFLENTNAD